LREQALLAPGPYLVEHIGLRVVPELPLQHRLCSSRDPLDDVLELFQRGLRQAPQLDVALLALHEDRVRHEGFEFFRPPLSTSAPNVEARNIRVVANLIEGSEASLAFVGCVDCLAVHNTVLDPTRWVIRILQETTTRDGYTFLRASGGTFANNLVWYSRSGLSTHVNVGAGTDAPSFTFSNNLWFAHDDPSRSAPTLPVAETNAVTGSDPLFVSAGFTLQAESPARGKGASAFRASGDLAGRCYATPPSIGAYEVP